MTVIDSHVHPFISRENNFAWYGAPGSLPEFISDLKRAGVSRACGSVLMKGEARSFEDVRKLNDAALEIRRRYPDFYIPGVHIHSRYPEESCRELERLHALGVKWIGELVPYIMKSGPYDAPGLMDAYALAQQFEMPINIHVYPSPLSEIETVAKNFPKLKIVIAHPGEGDEAKARFAFVAKYPNVFLDISGNGLQRWNMLRYAIGICGSQKIIFGSDFPICSAGMLLNGVRAESIDSRDLSRIFSENFMNLIHEDGFVAETVYTVLG